MNQKIIAVIGAGTMGSGIAQAAASSGFDVKLIDVSQDALHRGVDSIKESVTRLVKKAHLAKDAGDAVSARIQRSSDLLYAANADVVIEAVFEDEAVKRDAWKNLSSICKESALFASNTSGISITRLAGVVKHPERFIGMHFFNPVSMMKLVEIVRGNRTSDATSLAAHELALALGKVPLEARDYPGFVVNRVLLPMINEAAFAVFEGVATAESVDQMLKLGANHPMGPLALADFIGLEVCLSVLENLQRGFGGDKYRPCPLLRQLVDAGKLGRKSGEGFFKYPA